MMYAGWAALWEGQSDRAYFEILIPRVVEEMALSFLRPMEFPSLPAVTLSRGTVEKVATEACEARKAFHIVFIHSDTGGRGLAGALPSRSSEYCKAMQSQCGLRPERCIAIMPRHETEAWVLADPNAICAALGYKGSPTTLGLPENAKEAERLVDPKGILGVALGIARGRRRPEDVRQIYPAIAQRQSLESLRQSSSFRQFETDLRAAFVDLGFVVFSR